MKPTSTLRSFLVLAGSSLLAISSACAQLTWDANGTGSGQTDGAGAWLTANQWWDGSSNVNWTSDSNAIFGNTGAGGAVTLASPTSVNSITFNTFTGTYTLGTAAQTITLNNGITMNPGAGIATIISPITMGAAQSWTNNDDSLLTVGTGAVTNGGFLLTVGGTGNTTITSAIGGAGGLTMSGTGTLQLSGANSYGGATTISSGTVNIRNATALGTTDGGTTVASGATLSIQGTINAGNEALTLNGTGVTSGGALRNINNNNSYGGLVTLGSDTRIHADAGILILSNTGTITGSGYNLTVGGAGGATVINSIIGTETGALTKEGAGNLFLTGANTYTGATTLTAGILAVSTLADGLASSSIGASSNVAGNLILNGGTFLYTGGAVNTDRLFSLQANAAISSSGTGAINLTNTGAMGFNGGTAGKTLTLTGTNTGDNTIAAVIGNNSGSTSILKEGLGTWVLTGQNTYSGSVIVRGGTLKLQSGDTSIVQSHGALGNGVGDGTLVSNKAGTGSITTTFSSYSRTVPGGAVNIVSSGGTNGTDNTVNITGTAGFVNNALYFNGADFAARNSNNGYIRALAYGSDTNAAAVDDITTDGKHIKLTSSPSGAQNNKTFLSLNLQGGVTWTNDSGQTLAVPSIIKSGGGSASTISGGSLIAGATHAELVIRTDKAADSLTISSNITGGTTGTATNAALTKVGAGTLTLSGTNSYAGLTYVSGGLLKLESAGAIPGGIANTGGTNRIEMRGGVIGLTAVSGDFTRGLGSGATTSINFGTSTPGTTYGGGFAAFGGTRTVNFTTTTGGQQSPSFLATNGGGFAGGPLVLSHPDSDSKIIMANPFTIGDTTFGNFNQTIRVDNGSAEVDAEFTNIIGDGTSVGNGLIKTGTGTLSLSNQNTYTGVTRIDQGTLRLDHATNTLANTSSVNMNGGTLSIGTNSDTVGTLDVSANSTINLGAGATLAFAASNAVDWTGGALNLTGTLDFSGGTTSSLRFGTNSSGLTTAQLASISASGWTNFALNDSGYLTASPSSGPGPLDKFAISAIGSPQTVGTPITGITITAQDSANQTVTSFNGTVTFGGTGGFSGTSATFSSGVLSGVSVTPTVAGSNLTFVVSGSGKTGSTTIATIQSQYAAWANGGAFNADANGDGVSNGMAWLLGAAGPSAPVTVPTVSQSGGSLKLNFNMLKPANRGTATLSVQHSRDLNINDPWTTVLVTNGDSGPTNGVTFVVTPGGGSTNGIEATIGSGEAGGTGKLFGRLQANP